MSSFFLFPRTHLTDKYFFLPNRTKMLFVFFLFPRFFVLYVFLTTTPQPHPSHPGLNGFACLLCVPLQTTFSPAVENTKVVFLFGSVVGLQEEASEKITLFGAT